MAASWGMEGEKEDGLGNVHIMNNSYRTCAKLSQHSNSIDDISYNNSKLKRAEAMMAISWPITTSSLSFI